MLKYNIQLKNKTVFVTGAAGFIGSNLCKRLLQDFDVKVVGIDNMNDYYDVKIKEYRLNELSQYDKFIFIKGNISDKNLLHSLFEEYHFDIVVNLACASWCQIFYNKS